MGLGRRRGIGSATRGSGFHDGRWSGGRLIRSVLVKGGDDDDDDDNDGSVGKGGFLVQISAEGTEDDDESQ